MTQKEIDACFEISEAIYNMLNGDDVDSDPINESERERMEVLIGEDLEPLCDSDEVEGIVTRDMWKIHGILVEEGYLSI
ncbi:MAG TPA: hypothetical protein VMW50_10060 [Dehalococcoidia bacterium]|jgi:hypothetical protein|nr:hypothetical protein [Dehalococcoidia bacterium]